MATSLAKQLSALRQRPEHDEQLLESFLFTKATSHQFSRDQIHELALSGARELAAIDGRTEPFLRVLLDEATIRRDRAKMTKPESEELSENISKLLTLIGPCLHMSCAHRVIEYLVRVYEVHTHDVVTFITAFLPYHDQGIFVRAIGLCDLRGTGLDFLKDNQLKGAVMPRSALVTACAENPNVLAMVCDLVAKSSEMVVHNHGAIALWLGVATEIARQVGAVNRHGNATAGASEAAFRQLLPLICSWLTGSAFAKLGSSSGSLAQNRAAFTGSAIIALCSWASHVTFNGDVLALLLTAAVRALRATPGNGVSAVHVAQCIAHLFETQPAVHDAAVSAAVRSLTELPWGEALPLEALHAACVASPAMVSALLGHGLALRGTADAASTNAIKFVRLVCETQPLRESDVARIVSAALEDFMVADAASADNKKAGAKKAAVATEGLAGDMLAAFETAQRRFGRAFDRCLVAAIENARSSNSATEAERVTNALFRFIAQHLGTDGKYELVEIDASLAAPAGADSDDDAAEALATSRLLPALSCLHHSLPAVRRVVLERALDAKAASQPGLAAPLMAVLATERVEELALLELRLLSKSVDAASVEATTAVELAESLADVVSESDFATEAVRTQALILLGEWMSAGRDKPIAAASAINVACVAASVPADEAAATLAKTTKGKKSAVEASLPNVCKVLGAKAADVPASHDSAFWNALLGDAAGVAAAAAVWAESAEGAARLLARVGSRLSQAETAAAPSTSRERLTTTRALAYATCSAEAERVALLQLIASATTASLKVATSDGVAAMADRVSRPLGCLQLALICRDSESVSAQDLGAFVSSRAAAEVIGRALPVNDGALDQLIGAIALVPTEAAIDAVESAAAVACTVAASDAVPAEMRAAALFAISKHASAAARVAAGLLRPALGKMPSAVRNIAGLVVGKAATSGAASLTAAEASAVAGVIPTAHPATAAAVMAGLIQAGNAGVVAKAASPRVKAIVTNGAASKQPLDPVNATLVRHFATAAVAGGLEPSAIVDLVAMPPLRVAGASDRPLLPCEPVLRAIIDEDSRRRTALLGCALAADTDSAEARRLVAALADRHRGGYSPEPLLVARACAALLETVVPHLAAWTSAFGGAPASEAADASPSKGRKAGKKAVRSEAAQSTKISSAGITYGSDASYEQLLDLTAETLKAAGQQVPEGVVDPVDAMVRAMIGRVLDEADVATPANISSVAQAVASYAGFSPRCAALHDVLFGSAEAPRDASWARLLTGSDSSVASSTTRLAEVALEHACATPAATAIRVTATILATSSDDGMDPVAAATRFLKAAMPHLAKATGTAAGGDDDDDDVPTIFGGAKSKYTAGKKRPADAAPKQVQSAADAAVPRSVLPVALLALLLKIGPMSRKAAAARTTDAVKFATPEETVSELILAFPTADRLACLAGIADVYVSAGLVGRGPLPQAVQTPQGCPAALTELVSSEAKALADMLPAVLQAVSVTTGKDAFIEDFVRTNARATRGAKAADQLLRAKSFTSALYKGGRGGAAAALPAIGDAAENAAADAAPTPEADKSAEERAQGSFLDAVVSYLRLYAASHGTAHEVPTAALLGRLLAMVDEPTFLLVVRHLVGATKDLVKGITRPGGSSADEALAIRMIRMRGYEILNDRLVTSNDRRERMATSSLAHTAAAQLGGAAELSTLSGVMLHDLHAALQRVAPALASDESSTSEASDAVVEEVQWIAMCAEELLRLLGPAAASKATKGPLVQLCTAIPLLTRKFACKVTGVPYVVDVTKKAPESPAKVTVLSRERSALLSTLVTTLGSISQSLGFALMIPYATSFIGAALCALNYALHPTVLQNPDAPYLKQLRRRSLAAMVAMLPATWTLAQPWLSPMVTLATVRAVVEEDAESAESSRLLLTELASLLEPRVFFPAVTHALAHVSPARNSIGALFSAIVSVVERLSRAELKAMPDVMSCRVFTAALESMARLPRLPSDVTTKPLYKTFVACVVKFKEATATALIEAVVTWALKKRPGDATVQRRDVHRWTLAFGLVEHVATTLGAVGIFVYPSVAPLVTDALQHFCKATTESSSGPTFVRKSARREHGGANDSDDNVSDDGRGGDQSKRLHVHVVETLESAFALVRAMAEAVQANTSDALGDASTAPSELVPYFAGSDVFTSWAPALTKQMSNSLYLGDDRATYMERAEGVVIPAMCQWFASLRSPKLWSRAQAQLIAFVRHREAAVRQMTVRCLRRIYDQGGQELASMMLAEVLPQIAEATEDASDAVVEEARLFCDELSKVTGQDVLNAMTA